MAFKIDLPRRTTLPILQNLAQFNAIINGYQNVEVIRHYHETMKQIVLFMLCEKRLGNDHRQCAIPENTFTTAPIQHLVDRISESNVILLLSFGTPWLEVGCQPMLSPGFQFLSCSFRKRIRQTPSEKNRNLTLLPVWQMTLMRIDRVSWIKKGHDVVSLRTEYSMDRFLGLKSKLRIFNASSPNEFSILPSLRRGPDPPHTRTTSEFARDYKEAQRCPPTE